MKRPRQTRYVRFSSDACMHACFERRPDPHVWPTLRRFFPPSPLETALFPSLTPDHRPRSFLFAEGFARPPAPPSSRMTSIANIVQQIVSHLQPIATTTTESWSSLVLVQPCPRTKESEADRIRSRGRGVGPNCRWRLSIAFVRPLSQPPPSSCALKNAPVDESRALSL